MSDLDNEEIEATKELNTKGIEKSSSIEEKQEKSSCIEKSADELFEELGYTKYIDDNNNIEFYKYGMQFCDSDILYSIRFYCKDKEIGLNFILSMQELKAINKKCKELRMDMRTKIDEMILDEFGLEKIIDDEDTLRYVYKDDFNELDIEFRKKIKDYHINYTKWIPENYSNWMQMRDNNEFRNKFDMHCSRYGHWKSSYYYTDMKMLKLIYLKCKELGWLEWK